MRTPLLIAAALVWGACPSLARAQSSTDATSTYSLAVLGIPIAEMTAHLAYTPAGYDLNLSTHTTGAADVIVHGAQTAEAHGSWNGMTPQPKSYVTDGAWNGDRHRTAIDFSGATPAVKELVPPEKSNHVKVPDDMLHDTIDSVTTFAHLAHQVALTGRCDISEHIFDGQHVFAISGRSSGEEVLAHEAGSTFAGRAQRCDFDGTMIAGFTRGDEHKQAKTLHATAWLARIAPGWPPLPVRARFETRFFGDAVATLIAPMPAPQPVTPAAAKQ